MESVVSAVIEDSPWNCFDRSWYCALRSGRDSWFGDLVANASRLSWKDSRDLEMLESWDGLGSRFNVCARCLSSSDSLM